MGQPAYWLSPDGKAIPVDMRHIHYVIDAPEKFGLDADYIKDVHKKHKEKLYTEGNAREEIIAELMRRGWIRIRYIPQQDFYTAQINILNHRAKEALYDFAVGVTRTFPKADRVSNYTGIKIINMQGDILFSGDLNDITSFRAFQESYEKTGIGMEYCLFENYKKENEDEEV